MDDQVLYGLIGVVLGAILGWLFNYLGHRTTVADVNRRITNKVIYSLLNIRYELLKLNSEKSADEALSVMEKTMEKKIPDDIREQVKEQIGNTGSILMEDSVFDNLEEIGEQFKDVILSFAEISPQGAYRLSDPCKLLLNHDYFEDYMENVKTNFGSTLDQVTLDSFEKCLKRKSILEAVDSLKKEIQGLSKCVKKSIQKEIKAIIERQENPPTASEEYENCMKILFKEQN